MTVQPLISIVIPCYDMAGRGVEMLRELLASIHIQTVTDCEVVVSNYNPDAGRWLDIDSECRDWAARGMRITCRYGVAGAAANLNFAIESSHGDIIKPVFQDDKFMEPDSLQKIADAFADGPMITLVDEPMGRQIKNLTQWISCTSHNAGEPEFREYDHVPYPHRDLQALRAGENTYGSPSAMAWRRNDLRFDENLKWLFDCEFYSRMAERYGVPVFVDTPIHIRQWSGMATLTVATGQQRIEDTNYVIEKYRR